MKQQQLKYEPALALAVELREQLAPRCERIEIVGSLRRLCPVVGDVELLFIPKYEVRPDGLFDKITIDLAAERLEEMLASGVLVKRLNSAGFVSSWGVLNKHSVHAASGISVDLFATTLQNWFMSLVVRTGPKEFNIHLMTRLLKLGMQGHAYGTVTLNGSILPLNSELEVFELAQIPWLEPAERKIT
jgi:DNA polymerase/3'-5' exonuclease PolX